MHQLVVHEHVMCQLVVLARVQSGHVDVTWLAAKFKMKALVQAPTCHVQSTCAFSLCFVTLIPKRKTLFFLSDKQSVVLLLHPLPG
jgi:hypothetical protein